MKSRLIPTVLCLLAATGAAAQIPGRAPSPNDTLRSTQVVGNGKVAFRVYAPEAAAVTMSGDLAESNPLVMTRSANGVWEAVMDNIQPGVYRYYFNIDGVKTLDPKSEQAIETYSLLKYSPEGDEFFALKDVPHGALSQRYYHSESAGTIRRAHIWTPSGYEKMTSGLPVLYLIHGGGDTDKGWSELGAANLILDNLYAEGKIEPMIVVMPDGHIDTEVFVEDLCHDLIPFVEETYNVIPDSAHRALSGLSNGGIQTMMTILEHHDMFDSYIIMSSGWFANNKEVFASNVERLKDIATDFNKHVKLLIFSQGGPEDIAYGNGKATTDAFRNCGIDFDYYEAPGGHTWYTWRYNLRDFAPKLFKF